MRQVRIITQITRTLIGVSGIERVRLLNDGRQWGPHPDERDDRQMARSTTPAS
jgi:hypothetical protein